ncbi:MAG: hydroxypyruvate reductase [Phycisphaerales bacterium]
MSDGPLVIQAENLDEQCAAWLGERCELIRCNKDDDNFRAHLAVAQGLVIRSYTEIDNDFLDAGKNLRVIGRAGVGLDHVDLKACKERGVRVVHTPGANTQAVAELVFAMLLDVVRPRVFLHRPIVDLKAWKQARIQLTGERELGSLTLGVLGFGRIGSRVAQIAMAFGMDVIYHDVREIPAEERLGARPVSRDEFFGQADIVSVNVDGSHTNTRIIGADEFAMMKDDVVFVNTSRGIVVDPFACASFMIEHPSACAMLDVHDPEPFDATYPLLDIKNLYLTPHLGGATKSASLSMSWVVRDVWAVLEGKEPEHEAEYD